MKLYTSLIFSELHTINPSEDRNIPPLFQISKKQQNGQ